MTLKRFYKELLGPSDTAVVGTRWDIKLVARHG